MQYIELLSNSGIFEIGNNNNLTNIYSNVVSIGNTTNNINLNIPYDLSSSYNLILPNKPGKNGESLVYTNEGKLDWSDTNIIKQINTIYGNLSSNLTDNTSIIWPEDYKIDITPLSTTSKLIIQFKVTYKASLQSDNQISFYIKKTYNNNEEIISSEKKYGTKNGVGTIVGFYNSNIINESKTLDKITYSLGYNIEGGIISGEYLGILGYDNSYNNSIIIQEFEGSGTSAHSIWNKSSNNKAIYYNLGTVNIGNNSNAFNSLDISGTALLLQGNINGTNATFSGNIHAHSLHVEEAHIGPNTLYIDGSIALNKNENGSINIYTDTIISDGINGLTIMANGTNGNIILEPSGNGIIQLNGNIIIPNNNNLSGNFIGNLSGHIIGTVSSLENYINSDVSFNNLYLSSNLSCQNINTSSTITTNDIIITGNLTVNGSNNLTVSSSNTSSSSLKSLSNLTIGACSDIIMRDPNLGTGSDFLGVILYSKIHVEDDINVNKISIINASNSLQYNDYRYGHFEEQAFSLELGIYEGGMKDINSGYLPAPYKKLGSSEKIIFNTVMGSKTVTFSFSSSITLYAGGIYYVAIGGNRAWGNADTQVRLLGSQNLNNESGTQSDLYLGTTTNISEPIGTSVTSRANNYYIDYGYTISNGLLDYTYYYNNNTGDFIATNVCQFGSYVRLYEDTNNKIARFNHLQVRFENISNFSCTVEIIDKDSNSLLGPITVNNNSNSNYYNILNCKPDIRLKVTPASGKTISNGYPKVTAMRSQTSYTYSDTLTNISPNIYSIDPKTPLIFLLINQS